MRKTRYWLAVLLVAACLVLPLAPRASAQEGVLVGRIAYTEGQVLRFVPETRDWVATVKDAPFGMHDALYSDPHVRAELMLPNGLWVRIWASTQLQLIALNSDASDIDLASGVTRFYNTSPPSAVHHRPSGGRRPRAPLMALPSPILQRLSRPRSPVLRLAVGRSGGAAAARWVRRQQGVAAGRGRCWALASWRRQRACEFPD